MQQFPAYTVKKSSRAKNVIIKLVPFKGLEIVLPYGVSEKRVPEFLKKREKWLIEAIDSFKRNGLSLEPQKYVAPDSIDFQAQGKTYKVFRKDKSSTLKLCKNVDKLFLSGQGIGTEEELSVLKNFVKKESKAYLRQELDLVSEKYNLPYAKLTIRSQKKRWGSCSIKGNINLNMKLMFLPYSVMRYVLIHELCHTIHMNHSKQYWQEVAKLEPCYLVLEEELSKGSQMIPSWIEF